MKTFLFGFFIFICVLFLILLIYERLTRKYVSPYTFTLVFGKKGAGKTLMMQRDLIKHHKRGWHCFADSNTDLPFVTKIDATRIFEYKFPRNSFITIDEMSILYNNRNYANFDLRVDNWARELRKKGIKLVGYSQSFDVDRKWRLLTDKLAVQRKILRVFTYRRYYFMTPKVLAADQTRDCGKIVDDITPVPFLLRGFDFAFIPKYTKFYNTNEQKTKVLEKRDPYGNGDK